jgi:Flp pilus assembly pilin Flp
LVVALIALGAVGGVKVLAAELNNAFNTISTALAHSL